MVAFSGQSPTLKETETFIHRTCVYEESLFFRELSSCPARSTDKDLRPISLVLLGVCPFDFLDLIMRYMDS